MYSHAAEQARCIDRAIAKGADRVLARPILDRSLRLVELIDRCRQELLAPSDSGLGGSQPLHPIDDGLGIHHWWRRDQAAESIALHRGAITRTDRAAKHGDPM
jgi:hypothetical protein